MELTMSMFATQADYWKARAEKAEAEAEKLRSILDEEGYVKCPVCGSYDTGGVCDANSDKAADFCKACGHGW